LRANRSLEVWTDLVEQQPVIDFHCIHGTLRHSRRVSFFRVLNDRGSTGKRDRTNTVSAVIEMAGQDNSNRTPPERRRNTVEEDVNRRTHMAHLGGS